MSCSPSVLESSSPRLPDTMSGLMSLPDEVLKLVMRLVPNKDRLRSCCLVSQRMHAAAIDSMQLRFGRFRQPPKDAVHALQWLDKYGQHLTQLVLGGLPHTLQKLPCPNLLQLELGQGCCVQLGPAADGTPGVLQVCTKLTKLDLNLCKLPGTPEGPGSRNVAVLVEGLSSLVHLQHLHVEVGIFQPFALPADTLPRLQHLSYLKVNNMAVDNLMQLGSLPSLDTLFLSGRQVSLGPGSLPGLALPSSLKTLVFSWDFPAAAMLPAAPAGLRRLSISGGFEGPVTGPNALLACVASMTNLTTLDVGGGKTVWPDPGPAYSALTASSNLVSLSITHADPPGGIWRHVFPADHKLPHLTFLSIDDQPSDVIGPTPEAAWDAAELTRLVSCCPNLRMLHAISLRPGPHVSVLNQLAGLTFLRVWYGLPPYQADAEGADDDEDNWPPARPSQLAQLAASLQGLGTITQLQELCVACCEKLGQSLLLPLTSLTALSAFTWRGCGPRWYDDPNQEDYELELYTLQKRPAAPDVWLQLLDHCMSDPSSTPAHPGAQHPTALDGLAALLTGDRAEAAQAALMQYQHVRLVHIGDMVGELVDNIELNKDWQQRQLDKAAEQGVRVEALQQALRSVYEQLKEMLKLYPEDDGPQDDGFHELEFVAGCDTDSDW